MKDHTPIILRSLRKYYGINQVQLAQVIGVSQGTLSKLEAGILELSAPQWINLCQKYRLDPIVINTGRIEALENIKIDINAKEIPGNFKVAKNYQLLMGSTVRTVYPFDKYMENKIGVEKTREFFKEKKIDPDYFTIQNLPVNIKIIEDIFNYLSNRGFININNTAEILSVVPASEVHKYVLSKISSDNNPDKNFKKFTQDISELYEQNSIYTFEGDKDCFIKVRDSLHLGELNLGDEFSKFREVFNLSHFNKISPLLFSDLKFQTQSEDGGWNIAAA
jgi:DNA-binding XRE family transcriptional regulator